VRHVLAFDVGGTNLRAALIGDDGEIKAQVKAPSGNAAPEEMAERAAALAQKLEGDLGVHATAIGVGIAGMIALPDQRVAIAPNLGWRDVPFGDLLGKACGSRPLRLVNDLSAAAVAEARMGAARDADPVLCVFVGTGVGSALVLGGEPFLGRGGVAGEMGHEKIAGPQGRKCGCGARGCLEAYCGGRHLLERLQEAMDAGDAPTLAGRLQNGDALSLSLADEVARDPTTYPARLLGEAAQHLGTTIANAITLLNPEVVVLGGGVLDNAPHLRTQMVNEIHARSNAPAMAHCRVVQAELGDHAGLRGAGLLALAL
jgi:glucokinase